MCRRVAHSGCRVPLALACGGFESSSGRGFNHDAVRPNATGIQIRLRISRISSSRKQLWSEHVFLSLGAVRLQELVEAEEFAAEGAALGGPLGFAGIERNGGAKQVPVPTRNGVLWSLLTGTDTGRCGTRRQDKVVIGVPCDGKPRETALPEAKTLQAVACGLEAGQPEVCFDGRKPGARRAVHSNGESTEGRQNSATLV